MSNARHSDVLIEMCRDLVREQGTLHNIYLEDKMQIKIEALRAGISALVLAEGGER